MAKRPTVARRHQPWADDVHKVFRQMDVRQMAYVPDGGLARVVDLCLADKKIRSVLLTTEEEGIAQMHQGLTILQATGGGLRIPYYLALLAEADGEVGQTEEALHLLAEASAHLDKTQECWVEAELYRLRGDLLLAVSSDNHVESETCFQKAIAKAQNQSAKSLELRAATNLARLWQSQDKSQDAYELLAAVYGWFTEDFLPFVNPNLSFFYPICTTGSRRIRLAS